MILFLGHDGPDLVVGRYPMSLIFAIQDMALEIRVIDRVAQRLHELQQPGSIGQDRPPRVIRPRIGLGRRQPHVDQVLYAPGADMKLFALLHDGVEPILTEYPHGGFCLIADDVGVDAGGFPLQILRFKAKPLFTPILAKLHAGSHETRALGIKVLLFQEEFDVLGRHLLF